MYTHLIQDTSASNCKLKLMSHKFLFKFLFSGSTLNFAVQAKKKSSHIEYTEQMHSQQQKNWCDKINTLLE